MLKHGLRPESFTARDMPFLTKCLNRRVTSQGLKGFYSITQPISDSYITSTLSETKAWPSPQLIRGESVTLLCFSDAIYTVDESTYLCTLVSTKDATDTTGATAKAITAGRDWHFVDIRGTWMLFNGACTVFKTGRSSTVWVQDDVTISSGCVHRQARVLTGGFDATDFYSLVDWSDYWDTLAGNMPDEYGSMVQTGPGANWVMWGSYMAPDMLALFNQNMMIYASAEASPTTEFTTARPYIIDLMERNEAGMRPMTFRGQVQGILPLGEGVAVYGSDGVNYMASHNANMIHTYGVHPFRGLGRDIGSLHGTNCRTAFAGSRDRHIFIDPGMELWQVLPDVTATRIGFREHLSSLDDDNIIIQHDPLYDEFYIGDGTLCFVLNKDGLCRAPYMPSRLTSFANANLSAISFATTDPTTMEIESGTITSPSGGIETLTAARIVGLNSASNGLVLKIKSRLSQKSDFYTSAALTMDGSGEALLDIPYLQYRWVLTAAVASGVTVENVEIQTSTDANPGLDALIAASSPSAASE